MGGRGQTEGENDSACVRVLPSIGIYPSGHTTFIQSLALTSKQRHEYIQNKHLNYTAVLISTADLPKLYISTNSGIKACKKTSKSGKKKKK